MPLKPATTTSWLDELRVGDRRGASPLVRRAALVMAGMALSALAGALAFILAREPLPTAALAGFGVGVLGSLAIATVRYDLLVATGVGLLAVVRVEPAPADLVFGVAIAVALVTGQLGRIRLSGSIVSLATLFVALNLLSAVEVDDSSRAALYLAITIYLLVFAFWFSAYVDSRPKATLIAGAYVATATLSAVLATLALFVSFPGSQLLVYGGDRAQGFFKDPLVYAAFLVPPALIVAELAVSPGFSRFRRFLAVTIFLTLALGVLFAYSRGAWLNLGVGIVVLAAVLLVRQGGGRRILTLSAIVLAAGVVVLGTVRATGSEELLSQRTQLQRYDEQRFGAQLFGLEQSARYPLGIGPGQFEVLSPVSAHSLYVRALAEQGLLGLLTLLGLLLATLALALGNAAAGRDTYGIGAASLLAAWCGLLANSFVVDTLHWRHLWLVAALIWAGSALGRVGRAG
jgi:O-antigen ligase